MTKNIGQQQPKTLLQANVTTQNLSSFSTNITSVIGFCIFILLTIKVNSWTMSDLRVYHNNLFIQVFQLLICNFIGFALSIVYYIKHPSMTKTLIQNAKEQFMPENH